MNEIKDKILGMLIELTGPESNQILTEVIRGLQEHRNEVIDLMRQKIKQEQSNIEELERQIRK